MMPIASFPIVAPHSLPTPSPSSFTRSIEGSPPLPFDRAQSVSDFEIEHSPVKPGRPARNVSRRNTEYETEQVFLASIANLLAAKARPFTVSGRIPLDPASLILFFRSKSAITHSLDFPIDVEHDTPPALEVLIAACKPYPSTEINDNYPEAIYYPSTLPLTATLEIANHPILDAVRNTLFPTLPTGHFLVAVRDKVEIILTGGHMSVQPRTTRNDGRIAMIIVTLPVRFRGGGLVITNAEGNEEKFYGRGGKSGDMEWVAFLSDCDYRVETVQKGCRVSISYAVYLKSHGPSGINPDPLITPSDKFLDLLAPILNLSRGRRIAFYLTNEYGVNPSEVLADSLAPMLKGGDSMLYHAMKLYRLVPELRWYAGGYIWPLDRTVECVHELDTSEARMPITVLNGPRGTPAVRGAFGNYGDAEESEVDDLRCRVEDSGAVPLADTDIIILTDFNSSPGPVGRERVPFVSNGTLEKLIVNVLLVVYVP
ncbi:hypothetical protein JAAARDRAFT_58859 [Jaapia argillacea MUCL 33604]|uniref:Uncharacterized protein n=1 Tax=Jaapia argillacea MUCL 33604 TaxID=933084 RepID=A0A067PP36_9AGAM|nr:hypothetical protein JAAARDRAFT_58859 [Jaapia argillacea MUCL 33604]